jgi:hypothetical protein
MAHFVRIDENNIVQEVIVIANDVLLDSDGVEREQLGREFIASLGIAGTWLQCSYSGGARGRFPGAGDEYREDLDAFIQPKPGVTTEVSDWTLNEETYSWEPVSEA